ncbi:glycosyltransferase [Kaistella faecalis]|uniref:glycosyltransferase n=1 Tax=Kaistella faecalis TaxID=2852098 RepID=UPI001C48A716|nr:glycosyltransferase [Chryseobacterium faecale]UFK98852.1 putative rhamnosyl transferase [Chryseobacterium faecale]
MLQFIHIITTRFNVPTENWSQTRSGYAPLTDEWHEHRFDLFQKYTFPSFKNQKNKNFVWLVFFDVNTKTKYRQIINHLQNDFPNFKPVFVQDGAEINLGITTVFEKHFQKDQKFVISTDIDNDDLLHEEFVDKIQSLFKPVHNLVIDLRRGLQMSIINKNQVLVNEYYAIANPFVSLVENISSFKTIMNERHNNFRKYDNVIGYDNKPLFIQLIHTHNLMNSTLKTKGLSKINFKEFGIPAEHTPKIMKWKTLFHNLKRFPQIFKRLILRK